MVATTPVLRRLVEPSTGVADVEGWTTAVQRVLKGQAEILKVHECVRHRRLPGNLIRGGSSTYTDVRLRLRAQGAGRVRAHVWDCWDSRCTSPASGALVAMRDALRHRGPNGEGMTFVRAGHALDAGLVHAPGNHRTSDAGRQPMIDEPTGNAITFNGEICNYRELQNELAQIARPAAPGPTRGHSSGYAKYGPDAAYRFCGMFAFCILDKSRGLAWLCRDRLGIKPLYVARAKSGGLLFASEVRALIAVSDALIEKRASPQAIESFLAQGMVCGLDSLVEGVALVAPGESLLLDGTETSSGAGCTGVAEFVGPARTLEKDGSTAWPRAPSCDAPNLLADVPGVFLSSGWINGSRHRPEVYPEAPHDRIGFDQKRLMNGWRRGERSRTRDEARDKVPPRRGYALDTISPGAMDQPTIDGFNTYFVSRAPSVQDEGCLAASETNFRRIRVLPRRAPCSHAWRIISPRLQSGSGERPDSYFLALK